MKPEDSIPIIVSLIAIVVSVASGAVSIWAARSSQRSARAAEKSLGIETDRRADELAAAQQAADATRSAKLDAMLAGSDQLVIRNVGECRALNVQIDLVSDDGGRPPPRLSFDEPREIGPGLPETWKVYPTNRSAVSYVVHMTWTDQNGEHEDRQRVHI